MTLMIGYDGECCQGCSGMTAKNMQTMQFTQHGEWVKQTDRRTNE